MASSADLTRSLVIKTKMLQRLHKEYAYYQQEADKEHARVEGMKTAGADAHDLRQAENVLAESAMMVPETRQRLETALSDLQAYMDANERDVPDSDALAAAKQALSSVQGLF